MSTKTAFLTGGASGIGSAVTKMLHSRGVKVVIADVNGSAAESFARSIDPSGQHVFASEVDVASWDSQLAAFEQAVDRFGRIDYVFPIAGIAELMFVPNDGGKGTGFVKPNMKTIDVDLNGFIYTAALGVQQMRRQKPDESGCRGRIIGTASVCGFYIVPTLPLYTSAKHGVVGFVRSYGKVLQEEQITMNAICPHLIRTNIADADFFSVIPSDVKLVDMQKAVDAFESLLESDLSGECLEVGPNGGHQIRQPAEALDADSERLTQILHDGGRPLHLVYE